MKFKTVLSMLPVLMAMLVFSCSKAQAVDIGVGVGIGGGHHYHNGGVVEYRTSDPAYSTWYPDTSSSYVYTPSDTYVSDGYDSGYSDSTYIYATDSRDYNGWYGNGRSGHGGYYGNNYRGGHSAYSGYSNGGGIRGGGSRSSSGGGGGHHR